MLGQFVVDIETAQARGACEEGIEEFQEKFDTPFATLSKVVEKMSPRAVGWVFENLVLDHDMRAVLSQLRAVLHEAGGYVASCCFSCLIECAEPDEWRKPLLKILEED